jgi:hypothetical protein
MYREDSENDSCSRAQLAREASRGAPRESSNGISSEGEARVPNTSQSKGKASNSDWDELDSILEGGVVLTVEWEGSLTTKSGRYTERVVSGLQREYQQTSSMQTRVKLY